MSWARLCPAVCNHCVNYCVILDDLGGKKKSPGKGRMRGAVHCFSYLVGAAFAPTDPVVGMLFLLPKPAPLPFCRIQLSSRLSSMTASKDSLERPL